MKKEIYKYTISRLATLSLLSLKNAFRLHKESVGALYRKEYATAYFLSAIAVEELGKAFWVEHIIFHSSTENRMLPKDEENFLKLLYQHKSKQNAFVSFFRGPLFGKIDWHSKVILDGVLDEEKQSALYTGFKKNKKNIDFTRRFSNPLTFKKEKSFKQVYAVQKELLQLAERVRIETPSFTGNFDTVLIGHLPYLRRVEIKLCKHL